MIQSHPFCPIINKKSKLLIVGTLPPEGSPFYYSNSVNNRMWDILQAIHEKGDAVSSGGYKLEKNIKISLLKSLNLSMCDIIKEYNRRRQSVNDLDIIPLKYTDVIKLIKKTEIKKILFVYKNAALWFLHSLKNKEPLPLVKIKENIEGTGEILKLNIEEKEVPLTLLPNPLSRGTKGMTLKKKLETYRDQIIL